MARYDVVIMTDLRFPGGSSSSTLEEIEVQHAMGLRTGLYHRPSSTMRASRRPFHKGIFNSITERKSHIVNFEDSVDTSILCIRHPSVIHPPMQPLPNINTEIVVLIVNHPPINTEGRVDYVLQYSAKTLREAYGVEPLIFPIGPLVRASIIDCYDNSVALQDEDWSNIFDISRFEAIADRVPPVGRELRVGRHSRPGREKWPDTAEAIHAAYLADTDYEVAILGGTEVPELILGRRPPNWMVYAFGSLDVVEFLKSIDVFVYFHHPEWIEAFGRVIAEAMASGLPTILPNHFEPLFREGAIYAAVDEVEDVVVQLSDPEVYARASRRALRVVKENFSREIHKRRLMQLCPNLGISA